MTKIEWTDKVWNPVTGCTKVSAGCKNCYAARLFPWTHPGRKFTDVQRHADRLDQPLHWRKPRRVFVNSMSDLFHERVPWEFIDQVFTVMAATPRHTYQILTKRPEVMRGYITSPIRTARMSAILTDMVQKTGAIKYSVKHKDDGLDGLVFKNVWLGISAENQQAADERIPILLETPAAVRFVSCEPLLGPVDLDTFTSGPPRFLSVEVDHRDDTRLNWVIVGGESGHGARPMDPDWARSIRDQCQAAGVPFFFKQWGEWAPAEGLGRRVSEFETHTVGDQDFERVGKKRAGRELDGRTWDEYPK